MTEAYNTGKPLIQIGWCAIGDEHLASIAEEAALALERTMERQFPEFDWKHEVLRQPVILHQSMVDPLELLERGVQAKIECRWDFALVVTATELLSRTRPFTFGVPSSALETAVISTARFADTGDPADRLSGLAQFLFGSLLGLDPETGGAMSEPDASGRSPLAEFSAEQVTVLRERLNDIADPRLEELKRNWMRLYFRLSTLWADPRGIARDLRGYRPWKQPFQLGRLTAAAWVSALLAFLGAEVWELGIGCGPFFLAGAAIAVIVITSAFLFRGQNLSGAARNVGLSEQVARSEVILALCLFIGMSTLWLMLFAGCFFLASILPAKVIQGWLGEPLDLAARTRFAAFVSSLATLAGGLGGNLEDEDAFKARFYFDEEV